MNTSKALLGLVCALAAVPSVADPMRPLSPPPAASTDAAPRDATTPARQDSKPAPDAALSLMAIRRNSDGLRQAWLNERWVGLGDRVQGQPVTELTDLHVVLGRGADRRTLHLLPPLKHSPAALLSHTPGALPATQLAAGRTTRTTP